MRQSRERHAEYMREYRKRHPEYVKKWRSAYDKRAKELRPEWYNARRRRKRARNPETERAAQARRKEWLLAGGVTADELRSIYERDGGRCHYCACEVLKPRFNPKDPRGFDHVISRANGGQHEKSNIVVSCRRCNELKRDLDGGAMDC